MVRTPPEGERFHSYTLGQARGENTHGKKQVYTRAEDPDRAGVDQD